MAVIRTIVEKLSREKQRASNDAGAVDTQFDIDFGSGARMKLQMSPPLQFSIPLHYRQP